jgi:hypothetical protein
MDRCRPQHGRDCPPQMTPAPADCPSGRGVSGHTKRKRGLGTSNVVACALVALGLALVTGLLAAPPDQTGGGTDSVAQTLLLLAGLDDLYRQAETDARTSMQTYDGMLDPAGPITNALGSVGAVVDPTALDNIRQLLELQAVQP